MLALLFCQFLLSPTFWRDHVIDDEPKLSQEQKDAIAKEAKRILESEREDNEESN